MLQRYFYIKSNNNRITKDDMFSLAEFVFICMEEIDELGGVGAEPDKGDDHPEGGERANGLCAL